MSPRDVQDWLARYVAAWRANDASLIAELFAEDAVYGYRPWDSDEHTVRGRGAIVDSWLEEPDDPAGWEAHYEPYVVAGDRAVAVGWSRYRAVDGRLERTFHNAYLLRFDAEGRCMEFHEYYMLEG